MNALSNYLVLVSILISMQSSSISMVYNFRIAQLTKQPIGDNSAQSKNNTLVALLFDQYRKKRTGITQNYAGGLGSFIYEFGPYFARADAAVSHIHEKSSCTTTFVGTETDDILFTLGRTITLHERTSLTCSGLFGVPTHTIFRLQHADFGYNQVGAGVQLDGFFTFYKANTLIYGARYLYFVPRTAHDDIGLAYDFSIGNVTDLLVAYKNSWDHHGLEIGYTERARFGARISPALDDTVQKTNYVRSNFYSVYKYSFLIGDLANRLLFNMAYGFDRSPKIYGNKYILTVWGSWNISF